MRLALPALAACAAIGLGACGGDDEPATTTTTTQTTTAATGATGPETTTGTSTTTSTTGVEGAPIEELVANAAGVAPEEVRCGDEGGLESVLGSAGTCSAAGTEYVVADRGDDLELETLTARIKEIREPSRVGGDFRKPQGSKRGTFVVATLAVTNEASGKRVFDDFGEQVQLVAGETTYREPFSVLNGVATDSFLWKAQKIDKGRTASGDVVFDVPEAAAAELGANGSIQVLNFGDEGNIRRADQIGLLRTGESAS